MRRAPSRPIPRITPTWRASPLMRSPPMPRMCAPGARSRALRPQDQRDTMATAIIDGISTHYEVVGSGPPLLMYAPGGFNAALEMWRTQGVYAKIRLLDHLPQRYTCILFDRRECGQS